MAKRKERVAPPPGAGGWDLRYANSDAVKGWEQIGAVAASNARTAWERITADPRRRDSRQHPLKGSLGRRCVNGVDMEQWQYEVERLSPRWSLTPMRGSWPTAHVKRSWVSRLRDAG